MELNLDLEIEQIVLSCLICDFDNCSDFDKLSKKDFTEINNQIIFGEILNVIQENIPLDAAILASRLSGLKTYILKIVEEFTTSANLKHYIKTLRELTFNREYIRILKQAEFDSQKEIKGSLDTLLLSLNDLNNKTLNGNKSFKATLKEYFGTLDKKDKNKYYKTGYPSLDKKIKGLKPDLTVIAARPSMGKTALVLNIISNVINKGGRVLAFSLEMNIESLLNRLISQELNISTTRVEDRNFRSGEWDKLAAFYGRLSNCKFVIYDDVFELQNILTKSYNFSITNSGVDLIVIDYLQLIFSPSTKDNRDREIAIITSSLKSLSKRLNCCIIALAQLNRALEARQDKRPMLSDLRESGSIEQDADKVFMLYRDEYYNPDTKDKNEAELLIRKHRNGPTGCVKLRWFGEYTSFKELVNE